MPGILIQSPWLAAIPAAALGLLYLRRRRPLVLAAAAVWAGYGLYELGMRSRLLCSGECNIRVDLLLIYPALLLLSVLAVVVAVRAPRLAP